MKENNKKEWRKGFTIGMIFCAVFIIILLVLNNNYPFWTLECSMSVP